MEPEVQTFLLFLGGQLTTEAIKGYANELGKSGFNLTADMQQKAVSFFRGRGQRAAARMEEAEQMATASGRQLREVPGGVIFKWCEYASLEDRPELQRLWSALLANALVAPSAVLPGFIEILRQLTTLQAGILQWLYDMAEHVDILPVTWPDVERRRVMEKFGMDDSTYALLISDLERLQLVEGRRQIPAHLGVSPEELIELVRGRWNSRIKYDQVGLTTLGIAFLRSVNPPPAKAPE